MDKIVLIGCGRLGSAFVKGWSESGRFDIYVLDPGAKSVQGATVLAGLEDIAVVAPTVVVLAVKPHVVRGLLPELRAFIGPRTLTISLAAGITLDTLRRGLGVEASFVRAMPNTPAAVLQAITVAIGGEALAPEKRAVADRVLSAVGEVAWITEEIWMDAVTAVSGSGPAYFFRFAEALAAAGQRQGLPAAIAMRLARATLVGAGALVATSPDELRALRAEVTSPNGATAAAIGEFERFDAIDSLLASAVAASAARSRELGFEGGASRSSPQ